MTESAKVLDQAGWRPVEDVPEEWKDGRKLEGFDGGRYGGIWLVWWQPEFEAFISSCRAMQMHNGYTFEDGSTRRLHSPETHNLTHLRLWVTPDQPDPLAAELRAALDEIERLREALGEAKTDLVLLRANVWAELHKHGNTRWEGVPQIIVARIAEIDRALLAGGTDAAD